MVETRCAAPCLEVPSPFEGSRAVAKPHPVTSATAAMPASNVVRGSLIFGRLLSVAIVVPGLLGSSKSQTSLGKKSLTPHPIVALLR